MLGKQSTLDGRSIVSVGIWKPLSAPTMEGQTIAQDRSLSLAAKYGFYIDS